jgi:hypothetical protein
VKGAAGAAAIIVAVVILGGGHAATSTNAYACATTQTTPAPAHRDGTYTLQQLAALWVSQGGPTTDINGDGYPEHVEAAAIAMAESGGDPDAGQNHPYHGLWQIGPGGPFDAGRRLAAMDDVHRVRHARTRAYVPPLPPRDRADRRDPRRPLRPRHPQRTDRRDHGRAP